MENRWKLHSKRNQILEYKLKLSYSIHVYDGEMQDVTKDVQEFRDTVTMKMKSSEYTNSSPHKDY